MEFKRPNDWQKVEFEELVGLAHTGLVRSAKEQSPDRQYNYLKMNNLNVDGSFTFQDLTKVDASKTDVEKNTLKSGDFLFNTRNSVELVGKCGVFKGETDTPMLFNNNLLKVNFLLIKPEIVAAWFNSPLGKQQLRSITSATTSVAAIYQKQLMKLDVPIPPLAEQEVIAEKLDKLLAKVDSIKARLDAVPDTLKRFRQSVLAAAVSGKLTEEWRQSTPRNLRDIVEFKQGTQVPSPEQVDEQLSGFDRFLRIINFTQGDKGFKYVPAKKSNRTISEDDVVMVRYGATSGFVGKGLAGVLANNLFVISPNESLLSKEYLYKYLTSPNFQGSMKQMVKGGAMPAISFKLFDGIEIDLPSLATQKVIVMQVEKLFAYADKVEAEVNAAQERVNKLTQSILAKAFRGELTAKWREQNHDLITGDNSAEALLEKIKAEREKLKPTKKRKAK